VSLARLGARMIGVDFSPAALERARRLAADAGAAVEFVEAELSDAPTALGGRRFDFVFTGIGALCWLPRIRDWARVVSEVLVPGGWLFMREIHPMLWSLAERDDDLLVVEYPYFELEPPIVWDDAGTYVETDATFEHTLTHEWNHGLGEIVTALLEHGLELTMLVEHDSVPSEALPGRMTRVGGREWQLTLRPWRLPHSYTLRAVKPPAGG
jgi:SAM-dependent methyltransferase